MRINEITRLEGADLYEAIDAENNTGVKTSDLVKIVDAHRKNEWTAFDSAEDFSKYLDSLMENADGSKD